MAIVETKLTDLLNIIMTLSWQYNLSDNNLCFLLSRPKDMRIFNCTTERLNPLYWGMLDQGSENFFKKVPLDGIARLPKAKFTMSRYD